ncbi:hypothetical protein [Cellulomonas cellasea]|uniref:Uncharacterized protein n=2 Tax=Cellulomonas cellasea TaxID=43670 RepID=A0A0A0B5W0_9CELL|nr:hypothetical protein [Cellulomonas cellasea]KGM00671.1 hypothetical protein Q760_06895 [Cellulomonas cellasea DSM 20118]GEA87402.1 hypothetical protein CCE01nite_13510 [Cellulomonas cellasea]
MDRRELAPHLDAMLAALSPARWVLVAGTLLVAVALVVPALRLARAGGRRGALGRALVAGTAVAAVALAASLAWSQRRAQAAAADASSAVVTWVERTEGLRVTGPFRGCANDVPPPHAHPCLSALAVDDRGAEHRVGFRWYRLPDGALDVQVEVDGAAPPG